MRAGDLDDATLRVALSDERGVPLCGRAAEMDALRAAGYRDPAVGRIFEGHVNAAQLIARTGTPAQRAALERDVRDRRIFGVWNTQDDGGVRLERTGERWTLRGAKTWASGAGTIDRALITASIDGGGLQMLLIPGERLSPSRIDRSNWIPLGMERSESFRVDFTGLTVDDGDFVGTPGAYETQPWFFGGAIRFAAVQTGIVERLVAETIAYLVANRRETDRSQRTRVAQMHVAARTASLWVDDGARAWTAYDADPSSERAADVLATADAARGVVERGALDAIELSVRSVGARGLLEPLPFAGLVRDLQTYLRQPAPDAALDRVAEAALRTAISTRNAASVSASGTSA